MSPVLVDASVWVGHFRDPRKVLWRLLESERVLAHVFVEGELALGSERQRRLSLGLYRALPFAPIADHAETLELVTRLRLFASGVGWIDVALLASAGLAQAKLFTLDKHLHAAAKRLGCAFES